MFQKVGGRCVRCDDGDHLSGRLLTLRHEVGKQKQRVGSAVLGEEDGKDGRSRISRAEYLLFLFLSFRRCAVKAGNPSKPRLKIRIANEAKKFSLEG